MLSQWLDFLFFYAWFIVHGVCTWAGMCMSSNFPHPFLHWWWPVRLFPYMRYCKHCCTERQVQMSFQTSVFVSSDKYPEVESLNSMVVLVLLFEAPPYCFPLWLFHWYLFLMENQCGEKKITSPQARILSFLQSSVWINNYRMNGQMNYLS